MPEEVDIPETLDDLKESSYDFEDVIEEAMIRAEMNGLWAVVTERDGSRAAYRHVNALPSDEWVEWRGYADDGHTVPETRVRSAITMRWPDVELMEEPPEEVKP